MDRPARPSRWRSRKFLLAAGVAGLGAYLALGGDAGELERWLGAAVSAASALGYNAAEGLVDAQRARAGRERTDE